jgi:hypothetical protein
MSIMHRTCAVAVLACAASASPAASAGQTTPAPPFAVEVTGKGRMPAQPTLAQEFRRLLQDRYDGTRPDYKEFNERTIGETHVSVDESGSPRRITRAVAVAHLSRNPGGMPPMPADVGFTQTVEDVTVELHGTFAVVQYRREMRMVFNDEPVRKQFRCTEVFKRESGEWQSVAYHETVIPSEIVPARVDPAIYDDYVGQYRLFDGYVYTITRKGDTLMFNSLAAGDRELSPETETTFVLKGGLYRVLFARNDRGEVTHIRLREFPGVEYNAVRLK